MVRLGAKPLQSRTIFPLYDGHGRKDVRENNIYKEEI